MTVFLSSSDRSVDCRLIRYRYDIVYRLRVKKNRKKRLLLYNVTKKKLSGAL